MEEQKITEVSPEKPAQPKKRVGKIIVTILAVVTLLGLTGYGVYSWQQSRVDNLNKSVNELNSTVEELNNKVEKLKKAAEESSDASKDSDTNTTQNTQTEVAFNERLVIAGGAILFGVGSFLMINKRLRAGK